MPVLSRINIFPIKSLDGTNLPLSALVSPGALEYDREFVILNRQGDWVNAKRTDQVQRIRTQFDIALRDVELWVQDEQQQLAKAKFNLDTELKPLAQWLSDYLGEPVTVAQNQFGGFPDDTESPGPTVISTATLARVGEWFNLSVDEVRRRFRANLEIEVDEPFWEDQLVASGLNAVRFTIGDVILEGTNPCQRCPVPTRDSYTGEQDHNFPRTFSLARKAELPSYAPSDRFDHYFRLAVNTRVSPAKWNKELHVGDPVTIIGVVP